MAAGIQRMQGGAPKRWELMYPKKYIRQVEQVSIQDSQCLGVGMSDWQYDSKKEGFLM